eukprot:scaffold3682_cov30-Tisochrysis_lutea.AAC.3
MGTRDLCATLHLIDGHSRHLRDKDAAECIGDSCVNANNVKDDFLFIEALNLNLEVAPETVEREGIVHARCEVGARRLHCCRVTRGIVVDCDSRALLLDVRWERALAHVRERHGRPAAPRTVTL